MWFNQDSASTHIHYFQCYIYFNYICQPILSADIDLSHIYVVERSQLRWFVHLVMIPPFRGVLGPRTHWGDYISLLVWKHFAILQEELMSVAGEKEVWVLLLSLMPNGWMHGWMDGWMDVFCSICADIHIIIFIHS